MLTMADTAHATLPLREALAQLKTPAYDEIPAEESLNAAVARDVRYRIEVSAPEWVVPSDALPPSTPALASNNNVAIGFHRGRLYLAWRSAPLHFASPEARIYLVSSGDWGVHWEHETTIDLRSDLREPMFISCGGALLFSFFQAGTNKFAFEPRHQWRTEKLASGLWSRLETWGSPGEITWDLKVRRGRAWRTSYLGDHYWGNRGMSVFFSVSDDGRSWQPVKESHVYHGGVSEVSFEFLDDGTLWGITRNEDGDESGFGSQVISAVTPDAWTFPARSDPWRYDSPRMFKHGDDIYLVARRDPVHEYDQGFRWLGSLRKFALFASYGLRAKRTTLYRLDRQTRAIVPITDLPGAGDTAFPSILRIAPDAFLIANYTSPLSDPERSWLRGQVSSAGTQIYFILVRFVRQ